MSRLASLNLTIEAGIVIASIDGEVDLSNAPELEDAISESVVNEARGLVVDLSNVRYLDSSGIGLLFNLSRRLSRRRQRFAIVTPGDAPVRETLTVTGVPGAVDVHGDLRDALQSVGPE